MTHAFVLYHEDYDCDHILGVYASPEKAAEALMAKLEELNNGGHTVSCSDKISSLEMSLLTTGRGEIIRRVDGEFGYLIVTRKELIV